MKNNYIDEEIERLERSLNSIQIQIKDGIMLNKYKVHSIEEELKPLYIARGLGHMIIDGLKDNMLTIKTETRADHRDITIRPLKR